MKNINVIIFNSDLTVREQTEAPIQAFSSFQNIIRVVVPYGTDYIPFAVFHATNDADDVGVPTQLLLMLPNGTTTVDGETYYVYEQKVPEAIVASLRASKVEFVLSLWAQKENFIGVQRYDETAAGYNTTTYIANELLTDFPDAEADDYVRVFNTETDWEFDGTDWTDTDDVFETVLEDSRSEVVEFALYKGKSTGKPTHKPSNTEAIIESLNLKVNKSGDVMTGTLEFANAGVTRLILGTNDVTTDGQINATTFDNGDEVSDAIKYSDLATLFDITADTPAGSENYLDTYADAIAAKFDEYIQKALVGQEFLRTDGGSVMTGDIDVGNNNVINVNQVDGVDVSQLKTDFDNHDHTESDITDLDKYTETEVDNLLNGKANTSHTHVEADITDLDKYTQTAADTKFMDKDTYTDSEDKIKLSKLPDAAKSQTYVQDSTDPRPTENLLAGDKLYEPDTGDSYIYDGTDWVTLADADWQNVNLDWANVIGTPTTIGGYGITDAYTETETDNLLDTKSDTGHTHTESDITDLDKYTQTETDNLLDTKADTSHSHVKADITDFAHTHLEADITDLDKYTQTQVDNLLDDKADDTDLTTHVNATNNPHSVTASQAGAEPSFAKNTAFNKNFGTTADTVAEGDHVIDTSNPHSVTASQVSAIPTSEKAQADGVATLDAQGKIPVNQIPLQFDDVLQGYFNTGDSLFYVEDTYVNLLEQAEGKLYIDISTDNIYRWDGSEFVAVITIEEITSLGQLPDVNTTGLQDNYILKYDSGTSKWVVVDHTLDEINDVNVSGATDEQYLTYDNDTSKWVATTLPSFSTTLADLDDTTITTPVNKDFLKYDGTDWKNVQISKTDVELNNVQNYGIASQAEAEAGVVDTKYMTPLKTKQYVDEATIDGGTF